LRDYAPYGESARLELAEAAFSCSSVITALSIDRWIMSWEISHENDSPPAIPHGRYLWGCGG
jgi:hypothetical protein